MLLSNFRTINVVKQTMSDFPPYICMFYIQFYYARVGIDGIILLMINASDYKQHPCLRYHSVLDALCRPLRNLGVTFFAYTAVDSAGRAYCLGSKADYAAEYLKRNYAKSDIHTQPENVTKQYTYHFWDYVKLELQAKQIYEMAAAFNQGHTLTITRNEKEMTHCYHFSGAIADVSLNQRYLDKMDLLHSYVDFFDRCLADIPEISAIYQHPTNLANPQQSIKKEFKIITENPRYMNLPTQATTNLRFQHASRYYLTDSERQCLYWLYRGKSADMIAEIMQVTRKTIERHIASIKEKYGCYTLFQLGGKITESGLADFL